MNSLKYPYRSVTCPGRSKPVVIYEGNQIRANLHLADVFIYNSPIHFILIFTSSLSRTIKNCSPRSRLVRVKTPQVNTYTPLNRRVDESAAVFANGERERARGGPPAHAVSHHGATAIGRIDMPRQRPSSPPPRKRGNAETLMPIFADLWHPSVAPPAPPVEALDEASAPARAGAYPEV